MKQLLDGRSDLLKKTQSDILRLNVTDSVLTDKKELGSDLKEIDFISENNNLLKNACFENITDNRKLRRRNYRTYAEAVSGTKSIRGEPVNDVEKIGKSTLGKKDLT